LKANPVEDIFTEIADNKSSGKAFVLATMVEAAGHTPRDPGAKMLVYPDGTISGTIGGGNFEKLVIDDCLQMFAGSQSYLLKHYLFEETGQDSTSMICGGEARVFMELFARQENLVIFGGGHVCNALVTVAKGLDFKITVVDNRQEILNNYNPPVATIYTDESYSENYPSLNNNSYIVIVTQGHRYDKEILGRVIKCECAYIGMIGSKRKVAQTYASLQKEGIDKELLAKVHSPIGLSIGAEGPYEIAIAIAAEIISVRRKNRKK
jgi:xanthine dehydrogenase accessory factor